MNNYRILTRPGTYIVEQWFPDTANWGYAGAQFPTYQEAQNFIDSLTAGGATLSPDPVDKIAT